MATFLVYLVACALLTTAIVLILTCTSPKKEEVDGAGCIVLILLATDIWLFIKVIEYAEYLDGIQ